MRCAYGSRKGACRAADGAARFLISGHKNAADAGKKKDLFPYGKKVFLLCGQKAGQRICSLIRAFIIFCLPSTQSRSFSSKTRETLGLTMV